jgi:hypothetical protein
VKNSREREGRFELRIEKGWEGERRGSDASLRVNEARTWPTERSRVLDPDATEASKKRRKRRYVILFMANWEEFSFSNFDFQGFVGADQTIWGART